MSPADTKLTRKAAAEQAGMSMRQQVTALRVASVPADVFDTVVEDEQPATVTALAEMGKKEAPKPLVDLGGRDPSEFNRSMHFVAGIERYAREMAVKDLELILPGLTPQEAAETRAAIATIEAVHDRIVTGI